MNSIEVALLGSGSRGNATVVRAGDARVLVDCGFAAKELFRRMKLLDIDPESLDAILVTHEHSDHIRGVGAVARRLKIPVWMTAGTASAYDCGKLADRRLVALHAAGFAIRIKNLDIEPFAVPHDAREPCQYIFRYGTHCFGMLTDTGCITPHIVSALSDCNALLLECNHDVEMLSNSPYPYTLRVRVGGAWGHLNNEQASDLLHQLDKSRIAQLIIAHVSENNNTPDRVRACLLDEHPELSDRLLLASQDKPQGWINLSHSSGVLERSSLC